MKRIEYKSGDIVRECVFVKYNGYVKYKNNGRRRLGLFLCKCGNEFSTTINSVKTGNTKSCGCLAKGNPSPNKTHGLTNHPLYTKWLTMKQRCNYSGSINYKYYGGRGIDVYNEWKHDFVAYYNYVTKLPHYGEPGMTIDRINNDGNYEPGNLRWADRHTQAMNRNIKKPPSGYNGVTFYKNNNKWMAYVYIGKVKNLGYYADINDAVAARNEYIVTNKLHEYELQ